MQEPSNYSEPKAVPLSVVAPKLKELEPEPAPQASEGPAAEADALASLFGMKTQEVEIRGQQVTVRELTLEDLYALYSWLAALQESNKKLAEVTTPEARAQLVRGAAMQGVDLLNLCTNGAVPKGAVLPLGVATQLLSAIYEVNADFFDQLPTLVSLLGLLRSTSA